MPQYVQKTLEKLNHSHPQKPQHAPHKWITKIYGAHSQLASKEDETSLLPEQGTKYIQKVVGGSLYYGRAVNSTTLPVVNEISIRQSKPTEHTLTKAQMLLDSLASHPKAKVRFYASTMQLFIQSDAVYLVAQGAKSQIARYFYLGVVRPPFPPSTIKSPIHVEFKLFRYVVSSAAEAEITGIYSNCCTALNLINMLQALDHKQSPVNVKSDNSTAVAFSNNILKAKRSKSWNMRLH